MLAAVAAACGDNSQPAGGGPDAASGAGPDARTLAPDGAPGSPDAPGPTADAAPNCAATIQVSGAAVAGADNPLQLTLSTGATATYAAASVAGLSVASDGQITGAPTLSGDVELEVTATWNNAGACSLTQTVTVNVGCPAQDIGPGFDELSGFPFEFSLTHGGAVGASTFAVTAGAWPTGTTSRRLRS